MIKEDNRVIETMVPESPIPLSNEELVLQLAKKVEELTNENRELKIRLEKITYDGSAKKGKRRKYGF